MENLGTLLSVWGGILGVLLSVVVTAKITLQSILSAKKKELEDTEKKILNILDPFILLLQFNGNEEFDIYIFAENRNEFQSKVLRLIKDAIIKISDIQIDDQRCCIIEKSYLKERFEISSEKNLTPFQSELFVHIKKVLFNVDFSYLLNFYPEYYRELAEKKAGIEIANKKIGILSFFVIGLIFLWFLSTLLYFHDIFYWSFVLSYIVFMSLIFIVFLLILMHNFQFNNLSKKRVLSTDFIYEQWLLFCSSNVVYKLCSAVFLGIFLFIVVFLSFFYLLYVYDPQEPIFSLLVAAIL